MTHIRFSVAGLAACLLLGAGFAQGNDYDSSITRQQIERMDERARAEAKEYNLNSPSTSIEGTAVQGWMNQLKAEEEEKRAKAAEARRRQQAELEAWSERERVRSRELKEIENAERARWREEEFRALTDRQARMKAYVESLPPDAPLGVADYDRLLDIGWPVIGAMLPIADVAYSNYPEAFALRLGFLRLATCPGLRTKASARLTWATVDEWAIRDECVMRQPMAAMRFLDQARQSIDPLDAALACALLAGAYARLEVFDPSSQRRELNRRLLRFNPWFASHVKPCELAVPVTSPLYQGIVLPLVQDIDASTGFSRHEGVRVNDHLLWGLVSRNTWRGVDLKDRDAVLRTYRATIGTYRDVLDQYYQTR